MIVFIVGLVATLVNIVLVWMAFVRLPRLLEKIAEAQKLRVPLWLEVQKRLSDSVHHPTKSYQEADDLIDKLEQLRITANETVRLKELLTLRTQDLQVDRMERAKSAALIAVMDIVLFEGDDR